jgi:hypothetical protein
MQTQIRRANLQALIDDKYEGNRAAFCRAAGKNPNLINLILTKNPDHQRGIGEKLCRDIEKALQLPEGWLDQRSPGNTDRAVSVPISSGIEEHPSEWMVISPETFRGMAPGTGRANASILKVNSDSMYPTIRPGDLVIIDKSKREIDSSGSVFAVVDGSSITLARFRKSLGHGWRVVYDNENYQEEEVSEEALKGLQIVGRAAGVMNIKGL